MAKKYVALRKKCGQLKTGKQVHIYCVSTSTYDDLAEKERKATKMYNEIEKKLFKVENELLVAKQQVELN